MSAPLSLKRRLREYSGFLLFTLLLGGLIWIIKSQAASAPNMPMGEVSVPPTAQHGPKTRPSPQCPHCAPAGSQEIYIPLIDLPEAAAGEIVFNSRSPKPMAITPTFYTLDGTIVMADPVTIASEEIRYVDIKQLLPERYRNERGWGGFSLSYEGFNREMWSQYRFVGVNGGSNVDEFFTVKEESRSDAERLHGLTQSTSERNGKTVSRSINERLKGGILLCSRQQGKCA